MQAASNSTVHIITLPTSVGMCFLQNFAQAHGAQNSCKTKKTHARHQNQKTAAHAGTQALGVGFGIRNAKNFGPDRDG